ncbi:ImmA/IrrE family metallo-endopeptidase [Corallococcus exercitus]|uniref:ImmA/IrrE family metallo-endopeptidase n=2 Tax=Corallococcus exercitus TaxID=2316736 RepID=A0A7Y4KJ66_9BACT|nr:ImmA/IrrE family metallo-endopeptidase [Corallococcus exercitus]
MRDAQMDASGILRHFHVVTPPVPIEEIALKMGAIVEPAFLSYPGEIDFIGPEKQPRIRYNVTDAEVRQRFTIAHELAHLMLHQLTEQHRDTSFVGNPQEVQANAFAAALLMPFWLLEPVVAQMGPDANSLARLFKVSTRAMEIRLGAMAGHR